MEPRFVGRAAELRRITTGLARRRVVVLGGATGVGKSRLLTHVLTERAAHGTVVLATAASSATRAVPLSPFIPLLDHEPPTDPGLLLAGILRSVRDRQRRDQEMLIAVDDAQHLDDASVALLSTILSSTSARLALTVRTETPAPSTLTDLLQTQRAEHFEIGPLSRVESDELVEVLLGGTAPRLRTQLWQSARGNPLMLNELVLGIEHRLGRDTAGRLTVAGQLPTERLADLARARLLSLTPTIAHAIELLALAGPLPEHMLHRLVPGARLDEILVSGLASRLPGDGTVLLQTSHPLYGEVLRAAVSEHRAHELYGQLLAASAEHRPDLDPLRVASWQLQVGTLDDPDLAVAGARAALARDDVVLAERLLDQATGSVPRAVEAMLRAALLIRRGHAEDGERLLAGIDTTDLDEHLYVELVTTRAFTLAFDLARADEADELLRSPQHHDRPPAVIQRLVIERAMIAGSRGDFAETTSAARAALLQPGVDPATEASAYLNLVVAQGMQGRCDQMSELAEAGRSAIASAQAELPFAREHLELVTAASALVDGRLVPSLERARDARDDPERGSVRWLWQTVMSLLQCETGELPEATAVLEHTASVPLVGMVDLAGLLHGAIAMVRGHLGRADGLAELEELGSTRDDLTNAIWLHRGRAWLYAARGDLATARRVLLDAAEGAAAGSHHLYAILLLHDAIRFGPDPEDSLIAERLSQAVAHISGAPLGDLKGAHGEALADREPKRLLEVAEQYSTFGARMLAAEASAQAGTLHEAAGEHELAARATVRSAALLRAAPAAATPALRQRPELPVSERVLTVLFAAADGASSREIAERLFLSPRTVDNHLRAGYRALALSGRAELAELLATCPSGAGEP